jgi:hypothetical protein
MDVQTENTFNWSPTTIADHVAKAPKNILSAEEYNSILNALIDQGNNNVKGVSTVLDNYTQQLINTAPSFPDIVDTQLTALQNKVANKVHQEKGLIYLDAPKAMLNVVLQGTRTTLLQGLTQIRQHTQSMGITAGITILIDPFAIGTAGCITANDLIEILQDSAITLGFLIHPGTDAVASFKAALQQFVQVIRSVQISSAQAPGNTPIQNDLFPFVVLPILDASLSLERVNDLRKVATVILPGQGYQRTDSAKFVPNGVLYVCYVSATDYSEQAYLNCVTELKLTTNMLTLAVNVDKGWLAADVEKLLHVIDMCYDDTLVPPDTDTDTEQYVTPVIIPNAIHKNIFTLLNTVYTQAEALRQINALQEFASRVYADTQTALQEELVKITGSCTALSEQLESLEDRVAAIENPST